MTVCSLTGTYTYDPNVVVLWVASIANVQAPTAAEIAAGVDLQTPYNLTDIIGWQIETEPIRDGIWGPFEEQRMGRQSVADSRFMFAAARSGGATDIRSFLTRGQVGNVVILPSGPYVDYPAAPVNVYPARVSQLSQRQQIRTGQGSLVLVSFIIRARCGENVSVV